MYYKNQQKMLDYLLYIPNCSIIQIFFLNLCDFIRAREEMLKKGIDPDSPEAKLFGRNLLRALTDVFGRCILESGFFHAGKCFLSNSYIIYSMNHKYYDLLLTETMSTFSYAYM